MEVEFELTPEDLDAFKRHALWRQPLRRKKWAAVAVLFGTFVIVGGFHLWMANPSERTFLFGFVIGLVIGVVLGAGIMGLSEVSAVKKQLTQPGNALTDSRRLSLGTEGVTQRFATGSSTTSWSSIDAVETDAHHVFFYLDHVGRRTAYIVPKRAFSSDEAFAEFVKTARNYCEAAKVAMDAAGRLWQPTPSTDIKTPGGLHTSTPMEGIVARGQILDKPEPRPQGSGDGL